MSRRYDWVTFDCYGTLVDWDGGIGGAIVTAGRAAGFELDRDEVLAAYHRIEPEVQTGPYRSYAGVLAETTRRVAHALGWPLAEGRAAFLAQGIGDWPVFDDTRPALARLAAAGYRLGVLSNVDRELLAHTLRTLGVRFDLIVTAEDVRSYKPAHGHFLEARRSLGQTRWLHAAQSWFHDVVPAKALGVPVAWVNRKRERASDPQRPDHECADLKQLAAWLAP